jgi:hypothetical protein
MNMRKALLIVAATVLGFAGVMLACILPLRPVYDRGITWPITLIGVIAAILLGAGLLPPYWELYKRGGQVVGLNFVFLLIDSLGALFSVFSLVAQNGKLDILGCVLYIVILVLEAGLFISQGIWLLRTRKQRKAAKVTAASCVADNESDGRKTPPFETVQEHSAHAAGDFAHSNDMA